MVSLLDSLNTKIDNLVTNTGENSQSSIVSADGNGLPYTKTKNERYTTTYKRKLITWFIPEFGIVKMYVNPEAISYTNKKIINKLQTKGGFTLQYWGEQLTTIRISGTTGSSGIEGINMLYEIYRAEQYAEDSVALSLAAANANSAINTGEFIGSAISKVAGVGYDNSAVQVSSAILSGILGSDSPNANALTSGNIMNLAQLAFTVEMYYDGWVYRGFFEDFAFDEKASDFLMNYTINFTATQRRGYRVNTFPWNKSANSGPSENNGIKGGVPYSSIPLIRQAPPKFIDNSQKFKIL
jgi:hypothetical protein